MQRIAKSLTAFCILTPLSLVPARAAEVLPEPGSVHMAGTVKIVAGREWASVSLFRCFTKEDFIICDFLLTALQDGANDYKYDPRLLATKLVDNFHVDHAVVRSRLLNGHYEPQETLTLTKGESVWFVQEFSNARQDVETAKIVFALSREAIDVPVEHPALDPGPMAASRKP